MKYSTKFFLPVLIFSLLFAGCKEKEKDPCEDNAGFGGAVDLRFTLKHHSKVIRNKIGYPDSVYVIFNTNDLPGLDANDLPLSYNSIIVGAGLDSFVLVNDLKCGQYFFYGAAMDSTGPYRVLGGVPYTIAENQSGMVDLILPVTEGD